jgi:hypothetical protein
LARWTHIQLFVLVMMAILFVISRLGEKSRPADLSN